MCSHSLSSSSTSSFVVTVIIVDVDRLILAIFASVRTTTENCAIGTPLLHAFAFHKVDDCLRCWGSVVVTGVHAF